jgi:hypothetical protein
LFGVRPPGSKAETSPLRAHVLALVILLPALALAVVALLAWREGRRKPTSTDD